MRKIEKHFLANSLIFASIDVMNVNGLKRWFDSETAVWNMIELMAVFTCSLPKQLPVIELVMASNFSIWILWFIMFQLLHSWNCTIMSMTLNLKICTWKCSVWPYRSLVTVDSRHMCCMVLFYYVCNTFIFYSEGWQMLLNNIPRLCMGNSHPYWCRYCA